MVDQLEELITLCGDEAEREAFATALAAAATPTGHATVRVLAALRDDFASIIESVAGFRGRFDVFVLGPPSPDALARIVVEPARRAGVSIDPSLVADMVGEVSGRASALPLLSFTTARLWAARDRERRAMTRAAYDALGGVGGALASYADEIHAGFAARQRRAWSTLAC